MRLVNFLGIFVIFFCGILNHLFELFEAIDLRHPVHGEGVPHVELRLAYLKQSAILGDVGSENALDVLGHFFEVVRRQLLHHHDAERGGVQHIVRGRIKSPGHFIACPRGELRQYGTGTA